MSKKTLAHIRIAFLECGILAPEARAKHGRYGDLAQEFLSTAATDSPDALATFSLFPFDVQDAREYPNIEEIDAVIISGSKHNSFDNDPWILELVEFVRKILAQRRVRIVGYCFGHQIIGRALGGDAIVGRGDNGWEVSVTPLQLTSGGQEIFGRSQLKIYEMHRDVVYSCPEGTELLASSSRYEIQSLYIPERLMTFQGHPEYTAEIISEVLHIRHNKGIFDDEMLSDALQRLKEPHDGYEAGRVTLKFLAGKF
ncbi:BgTH12-01672 [Blumeria graminis f. sp. triticale]|uniref:Bgt-167 n=3 Tax=Blumeria graminis TaxID=34373 RepID=A0A381LFB1_BLUGR|nr:hypothetical protein BGT96224_167 [Blumeria graminis f. sp. tritici 96224]CAD6501420.1 BgTH12-01672 [Blumeria graminis f. sp. triticale]VDB83913.1 Bgt-167 [Blumeria graminis f. sp. tritici]